MATTSTEAAALALRAMQERGVPFAFLHGEAAAADGRIVGDYDLLIDARSAADAVGKVRRAWRGLPLRLIAVNEYDAGSVATWLVSADGRAGAQVDLTYDRSGVNQFGLAMGPWLAGAVQGKTWPTVEPHHESEYCERKRALKRGDRRSASSWRRRTAETARVLRRLEGPGGFEVQVLAGADVAYGLADRFSAILPNVTVDAGPVRRAVDRRRPGISFLTARGPAGRSPHLVLRDADLDRASDSITGAMSARMERRWRTHE